MRHGGQRNSRRRGIWETHWRHRPINNVSKIHRAAGKWAPPKSTVPPQNSASPKSILPPKSQAPPKFTLPLKNSARAKSTVPPEKWAPKVHRAAEQLGAGEVHLAVGELGAPKVRCAVSEELGVAERHTAVHQGSQAPAVLACSVCSS